MRLHEPKCHGIQGNVWPAEAPPSIEKSLFHLRRHAPLPLEWAHLLQPSPESYSVVLDSEPARSARYPVKNRGLFCSFAQ